MLGQFSFQFKVIATVILLVFLGIPTVQSQNVKVKVHRAWIQKMDESRVKGYLVRLDSSEVVLLVGPFKKSMDTTRVRSSEIKSIKIRRKGSVLKGAAIGALTGALLGTGIGFFDGDDTCRRGEWCLFTFTAEEKAMALGTFLGITGGIVGALTGTRREIFAIEGELNKYHQLLPQLESFALLKKK